MSNEIKKINLFPWREELQLSKRQCLFFLILGVSVVFVILLLCYQKSVINSKLQAQYKQLLKLQTELRAKNEDMARLSINKIPAKNFSVIQTATGEKQVSVNFQDVSVRAALQLLAQTEKFNLVVSESVRGNITLHVENLAWQKALEIILKSQGLGKRQLGNVLLIAPMSEIATYEKQQLQAQQQLQDLVPLRSELIPIHYGKAVDIASLLKAQGGSLLSSRGNVGVDVRTNTVWVQDTPQRVQEIRDLVVQLDIPTKQVLIEARIVNVDSGFERELGVRFGITQSGPTLNAQETGAISPLQRLHVDLPAIGKGVANGAPSFGLALAKLSKGVLLDLELSALESEGVGQIISSPRLITADQQNALIEAGEEIPYQQETSGGSTNMVFKKAVLSLNVLPQITPDGKIILHLKVHQDKPGAREVLGVPAIDTRHIETQVLVENGQTVVLGGIYEQTKNNEIRRVPFLGALPGVGVLFRHTAVGGKRRELLVFVTPTIISEAESIAKN